MTAHKGWGILSLLVLLLPSSMAQVIQLGTLGLGGCSTFFSLGLEFYMSLVRHNPKDHKCGSF